MGEREEIEDVIDRTDPFFWARYADLKYVVADAVLTYLHEQGWEKKTNG